MAKKNWAQVLKDKVKAYFAKKKEQPTTMRTKAVSNALKTAGITQKEMDRLRGKK